MRVFVAITLAAALLDGAAAFAGPGAPFTQPSGAPASGPASVSAAIPPTAPKEAIRKLLLGAYAQATRTTLGDAAWNGDPASLKGAGADPGYDLALIGPEALDAGCKAGLFDRLDWPHLGRERFLAIAASDCGAGAYAASTVLAWDRDKPGPTPGWPAFWDVAKQPGRRGLHRGAVGNLEFALMADGVAVADIYRTLRAADGVDRAFRKLDQLKPYIVWWDQPSQPAQLLAAGKVLLTSAPAAAILQANLTGRRRLGVQYAGGLTEIQCWAVPHLAAHRAAGMAAMLVASDGARQAIFSAATGLGPTTTEGLALLPTELLGEAASAPANLQSSLVLDGGFWAANRVKLEARFSAWLVKP